jgi:hypothetical protein
MSRPEIPQEPLSRAQRPAPKSVNGMVVAVESGLTIYASAARSFLFLTVASSSPQAFRRH